MAGGRPPKFRSAKKLQEKIDAYFDDCDAKNELYTVPGLAYFLGFAQRQTIHVYEGKTKFSDTIKKAKLRIEIQRNKGLLAGQGSAAGHIFDLKNNFGWKDIQGHEISGPEGRSAMLTNMERAAKLRYLIEMAFRKKREQEAIEAEKAKELPNKEEG